MSLKEPLWLITARDVMTQQRATHEPLNQIIARLTKARRLGSHERKQLNDAVYGFIRKQPWPTWFIQKLIKEYKEEASILEQALRARAKPVLAVDRRFNDADEIQNELKKINIQTSKSQLIENALLVENEFLFDEIPKSLQKSLWLMDEGSQIIAHAVNAKPGDLVLDMCAGGGGKTRYLLQTDAEITAMDISEKRIQESLKRDGVKVAKHVVADGLNPPFVKNSFDWILVDAPCSGTGTLRRAPDVLTRLTEDKVKKYAGLQKGLICSAVNLLNPGGKLVYATCSILPEENRQIAEWVQKEFNFLKPLPLNECWKGLVKLELGDEENQIQLLPSKHGCDGFFVAAFIKI